MCNGCGGGVEVKLGLLVHILYIRCVLTVSEDAYGQELSTDKAPLSP